MPRTLSKNPKSDLSRLRRHAANHLGVIMTEDLQGTKEWRSDYLDLLDRYYDNEQYDDLVEWQDAMKQEVYVPVRDRKPRVIYNLGKVLVDKVAAKIIGASTFPQFVIEEDEDDTAFINVVMKAAKFKSKLIDPVKHTLISGACFVRYYLVNGAIQIEYTKSKYCWPVFDAVGELESVEIKYVFDDSNDRDQNGTPKKKWYRIILTKTADILYDTPDYRPGSKPTFTEVARAEHGLGWVQGEWFVTHDDKFNYDGYGLYGDILSFIDEINYSLSQGSQASSYNQDPQLTINGVDEDELDRLIRSSEKAWNLGKEGKAQFAESNMKGVEAAIELRGEMRKRALDVVRVVLHDPDEVKGQAQSGDALRQLNQPLIELVDELRAYFEPKMVALLIKISMTCLHYNAMGEETAIEMPPNYLPTSLSIEVKWPAIFPATLADIAVMATAANTFSMANIVSRETLTAWIAANTSIVSNVDEELQKIATQPPPPNPFGDMGGGGF